jgi:hypothetical protein
MSCHTVEISSLVRGIQMGQISKLDWLIIFVNYATWTDICSFCNVIFKFSES